MNKTIIVIALIVAALVIGFFVWQHQSVPSTSIEPSPLPEDITLFYSESCPHCTDVEDYISENSIRDKLSITDLEVSGDQDNLLLLADIAQSAGVDINEGIPVPFLWDGQQAYIGGPDIISFLKEKAGI